MAGALNFIGRDTLFGRYWGCTEDHPCLHFELCYYQAIDYAIAHGLRVEAGAQGEHKLARGYLPVAVHSLHWIADAGFRRAIADYLKAERQAVERGDRGADELWPVPPRAITEARPNERIARYRRARRGAGAAAATGWAADRRRQGHRQDLQVPEFQRRLRLDGAGRAGRREDADHHPEWKNVYRTVEVVLSTHSAGGITGLDIDLATAMDRFAAG